MEQRAPTTRRWVPDPIAVAIIAIVASVVGVSAGLDLAGRSLRCDLSHPFGTDRVVLYVCRP